MFLLVADTHALIAHRSGHILRSWMLHLKYTVFNDEEKQRVELGFARFYNRRDTSSEQAVVDESLLVLATTHQLATGITLGFLDLAMKALSDEAGPCPTFEEFVAVYLAQAFGPNVRLCDGFDFGKDIPVWALLEDVELVALSSDRDHHVVDHSIDHMVGSPSPLCCSLTEATETIKWFQKSYTMMCFPDNHLAPDLVFFIRLSNGRVLCVIVQATFRSKPRLSKHDQDPSVCALESHEYNHKVIPLPGEEGSLTFLAESHHPEVG
jgi:hypothetical protein